MKNMEKSWKMSFDVHDFLSILSFWRQGQAAHSCTGTGLALGNASSQHSAI